MKNVCYRPFLLVGAGLLTVTWLMVFLYAPEEQTQGNVQRIFYIHLGLVAGMYIPIFLGMLFAIMYLSAGKSWMDSMSVANIEIGYLCTTGVLIAGSIWARPVWGTWWTWEPRLTTTLLIWIIYSAYLIVRSHAATSSQARKWCAIIAIIGFLDVPLIHYSVRFFRGVHPTVVSSGGVAPPMLITLFVTMITFTVLAGLLVLLRYRIEELQKQVARNLNTGELP